MIDATTLLSIALLGMVLILPTCSMAGWGMGAGDEEIVSRMEVLFF